MCTHPRSRHAHRRAAAYPCPCPDAPSPARTHRVPSRSRLSVQARRATSAASLSTRPAVQTRCGAATGCRVAAQGRAAGACVVVVVVVVWGGGVSLGWHSGGVARPVRRVCHRAAALSLQLLGNPRPSCVPRFLAGGSSPTRACCRCWRRALAASSLSASAAASRP
jgi:hypothetical protein